LPAIGLRIITGLVFGGLILAVLLLTSMWVFALLAALLAGIAFYEYARMTPSLNRGEITLGIILCLLVVLSAYVGGLAATIASLSLAAIICGFVFMAIGSPAFALEKTALAVFGFIYIGGAFACLLSLLQRKDGLAWVIFLLLVVAATDSVSYGVGSLAGRHKLVPRISPNKTWEGLLGGLTGAALIGLLCFFLYSPFIFSTWWQMLLFTLILSLSSVAGDLFESAIKRIRGVKDSGRLLPGHGGMLDRLDSYLAAMPAMLFMLHIWPLPAC
jgi:phosphatidate cytidylyltransferase